MTSLFFIVLVLFVLTFVLLKKKEVELQAQVEDLDRKLKVYTLVEENLTPLKQDTALFTYEAKYKRFKLGFDVNFERGKYNIKAGELKDYAVTSSRVIEVGKRLRKVIDQLINSKRQDSALKNISYLLIVSGYASQLDNADEFADYDLSYNRAYSLWKYWKDAGMDFESPKYSELIDLQIAGNGWGGVGRFPRDPGNFYVSEIRNQRFIIQIVPKIGDTSTK